jgi:hypothetical protein
MAYYCTLCQGRITRSVDSPAFIDVRFMRPFMVAVPLCKDCAVRHRWREVINKLDGEQTLLLVQLAVRNRAAVRQAQMGVWSLGPPTTGYTSLFASMFFRYPSPAYCTLCEIIIFGQQPVWVDLALLEPMHVSAPVCRECLRFFLRSFHGKMSLRLVLHLLLAQRNSYILHNP